MIIKNEYLREWIDENYPLMKEDENCLIELDYFDMDRFSEWLVNKLNIGVVSKSFTYKDITKVAEELANQHTGDKKDPVWRDIRQDGIEAIQAFISKHL